MDINLLVGGSLAVNAGGLIWLVWQVSKWHTRYEILEKRVSEHENKCDHKNTQRDGIDLNDTASLVRLEASVAALGREVETLGSEFREFRSSVFVQAMNISVRNFKSSPT